MEAPMWALLVPALMTGLSGTPADSLPPRPQAHPHLVHARTVVLGYDLGDRFVPEAEGNANIDVLIADREALAAVRDLLEEWGRYEVVDLPTQADLVISLRTGRIVSILLEKQIGGREPASRVKQRRFAAEVSPNEDALSVFECSSGEVGPVLWRERVRRGLSDASMTLFTRLREAVDAAPDPH
jgi:hypothetical protein